MVAEENGPAVPELARRMTLTSCHLDPARALAPVLPRMPAAGIPLGDIIADSGYAHRDAAAWAIPLRARRRPARPGPAPARPRPAGHPPRRDHRQREPVLPRHAQPLLELGPLPPGAAAETLAAHDQQAAELARHKLGRLTADDADGYHRVTCPAVDGQDPLPAPPRSMTLNRDRPEILTPPRHPPACCTQQTITVPPNVAAKTRQKHDYPSPAWRRSYARRTGAERTFATIKDPATTNIARGWCRLTGLTPLTLWIACLLAVRNQRILTAYDARQADNARRAAAGLPPNTRKRRRTTSPARRRPAITSTSSPAPRHLAVLRHTSHPGPCAPRHRHKPDDPQDRQP